MRFSRSRGGQEETGTRESGVMKAKWSESKNKQTKVTGGEGSVPTGNKLLIISESQNINFLIDLLCLL